MAKGNVEAANVASRSCRFPTHRPFGNAPRGRGASRQRAASGPAPSAFNFSISACPTQFPQEVILTRVHSYSFVTFRMETPCGICPPRPQAVVAFPPGMNFQGRTWSDLVGLTDLRPLLSVRPAPPRELCQRTPGWNYPPCLPLPVATNKLAHNYCLSKEIKK